MNTFLQIIFADLAVLFTPFVAVIVAADYLNWRKGILLYSAHPSCTMSQTPPSGLFAFCGQAKRVAYIINRPNVEVQGYTWDCRKGHRKIGILRIAKATAFASKAPEIEFEDQPLPGQQNWPNRFIRKSTIPLQKPGLRAVFNTGLSFTINKQSAI